MKFTYFAYVFEKGRCLGALGGTAVADITAKLAPYFADVFEKGAFLGTQMTYEIHILCIRVRERALFRCSRGERR